MDNKTQSSLHKGTVIYFSHGGGPLPILGDKSHQAMNTFMEQLPATFPEPEAVIVISAHWEEKVPTLLGHPSPEMFYDYYGFPPEAYKIQYPAPGNRELAAKIRNLLSDADIESQIDPKRGFDHGLFIPMKMMYPKADISMLQLSLIRGLDPVAHIELGKALRPLLDENILIIGSGFSFHNMQAFDWSGSNTGDPQNDAFQNWLIEVCSTQYDSQTSVSKMQQWAMAPSARYCHPREEHLLPLHVCFGLTEHAASVVFDDYILGKRAVAFNW